MKARDVLKLIPEGLLGRLALKTEVDHQVKKLSGEVVFKLILFSLLSADKLSLRVMETFLTSAKFVAFCDGEAPPAAARYNSLSERFCAIKADYFQKLFEQIFQVCSQELHEQTALCKTDSTYVALAAKLFPDAMVMGRDKSKRYVKYVVRLKGSLPAAAEAFTDQEIM